MTCTQDIVDALSTPRRRLTLRELHDGGACEMRALSEAVAAAENDKPVRKLSAKERKRVYISLYQCHLKTLRDCGMIEWGGESTDPIVPTAALSDAIAALDALERVTEPGQGSPIDRIVGAVIGGDAA